MKREVLIRKWLDNELNSQELDAFKQLEDHADLIRLSQATKHFKPEKLDTSFELEKLNNALKSRNAIKTNWLKPLLGVAAILAICFSLYYFTSALETNFATELAQKENVLLPENTKVKLNAKSALAFNSKDWKKSRNLDLTGEAYFKVSKGSKFTVHTSVGDVSVLGTEFNIKDRDNLFEVVCYEGSVKVEYKDITRILKLGESFLVLDNKLIEKPRTKETRPFWINNESYFKSMPFSQVIAEFERQYNVTFSVNTIDTNQLFTGSFAHNNLDIALQAITIPLNLAYTKNNNKISLKRE